MPRARFHLYLSLLLLALAAGLTAPPVVDLTVAAWFHDGGATWPWVHEHRQPWLGLYEYGTLPTWVMVIAAGALLVLSARLPRLARQRRRLVIIVLAVVLGPGLAINAGLKEYWGRPRPNRVQQFGQSEHFHPWWRPSRTEGQRSFASGHVSMAFALLAGTLTIESRRRRRWATAAAAAYGSLMIAARVVAGAHWISDALLSAALTYLIVSLLLLLPDREAPATITAESAPRSAA